MSSPNKFLKINSKNKIEEYKKPLMIAQQRFFSEQTIYNELALRKVIRWIVKH